MSDPLSDLLRDVRRSLRRAGIIRGAALFGVALVGGLAAASLVDFGLRPASVAARIVISCIALAPAAWVGRKLLWPAIRDSVSDVELARLIEERDPGLRGRLAAATAFRAHDGTAGSCELQDRLVAEVVGEVAADPPRPIIDPMKLRRAVVVAALVGSLAIIGACARPVMARSALLRLALPFAKVEWPRAVQLVLTEESGKPIGERIQIGRGQTLRFRILNANGDVPNDLTLEVVTSEGQHRLEGIPTTEESSDSTTLRRLVGVGSLFADSGPLQFRVLGGDDRDMPFVVADVLPQPELETVLVTVTPPPYLHAEAKTFRTGMVTGIVGSAVEVRAASSKPLASARLLIGDDAALPARIDETGRGVTIAFPLEQAGVSSFRFRLEDRSGLVNDEAGQRELRVLGDAAPTATIATPADDVTATADAELPIVVEAADDHGLTTVRIPFSRDRLRYLPQESNEQIDPNASTVSLFSGPDRPLKGSYPLLWSLAALELRPGDRLEFCAEATDAFDLGPPHVGRSTPRSIRIVSAAEKRDELLDRQSDLLESLVQVHADEERVLETVRSLRSEAERTAEVSATEHDLLSRSELEQRRIANRLTGPDEGLLQHAAQALSEFETNQLDDPALESRLQRIVAELQVLDDSFIPAAEKSLTEARKAEERSASRTALAAAANDLGTVLQSVQALLDELDAWRSRRDLASEANELLAQQRELREETAKIAAQTLGTASGQLTEQQTLTLDRLRLRQNGLAERLTRFDDTVRQLADSDATSRPPEAEEPNPQTSLREESVLDEASELLQNSAMPAAARAAVDSIRSNNLGEAGRLQRQLVVQLQALSELLTKSDGPRADGDALKDASLNLEQLADQQEQLIAPIRESLQNGNRLDAETRNSFAEKQARLREQTAAAATKLRSASVSEAADATSEAASSMTDGLGQLRREDDQAAVQKLEQARDRLRSAANEATHQATRAERNAAQELVDSSAQVFVELSGRQGRLNDRVRQLAAQKSPQNNFSRSDLLVLRKLSDEQQGIAAEAERIAPTFQNAVAIRFALDSAIAHMRRVESSLAAKRADAAVQRYGETAKARLDEIASAFEAMSNNRSEAQPDVSSEEASNNEDDELVPIVAQLEVLKRIQQHIHRETRALNEARGSARLTPEQEDDVKFLAREQNAALTIFRALLEIPDTSDAEAQP